MSDSTTIVALETLDEAAREALARITLAAARDHSPSWLANLDAARTEVAEALDADKVACVALTADGAPVGWVAAEPAWGRIWELHPLIVAVEHHRLGHGRQLVCEIEQIARARGALTMMLGTSDTAGATSLHGADLYNDTFAQLANLQVHRPHAVEFWRRVGYQIIGVIPDAEGPGLPSIQLARRLDESVATAPDHPSHRDAR